MSESTSASHQPPLIKEQSMSLGVVVVWSALAFAVMFALSILTSAVIAFRQPRIYESSVVIKVEPERPAVVTFESSESPGDPYFQQTQFEIIQSQRILHQVIERLNLQDRWAQNGQKPSLEVAYRKLRSQLTVRRYRETDLIEIVVRDTKPAEAAEIADSTAKIYQADRLGVRRQQVAKGLNTLREELDNQAQRVEVSRQKVEQLRRALNIPASGVAQSNDVTDSAYRIAQRDFELEERLYEAVKTRVQQVPDESQALKSPVEIIDQAVPAAVPLMSNIARGLARGALVGFPVGLVLSLLTAFGLRRK
jgi:uncharacterized protein involved in exopolysaccharide biosynthesis